MLGPLGIHNVKAAAAALAALHCTLMAGAREGGACTDRLSMHPSRVLGDVSLQKEVEKAGYGASSVVLAFERRVCLRVRQMSESLTSDGGLA